VRLPALQGTPPRVQPSSPPIPCALIMETRRALSVASFERFPRDRDVRSLVAAAGPAREEPTGPALWPEVHRTCDLVFDGQGWRVCRVVDAVAGDTSLFLVPTDTPSSEPGVSYSLQGDALVHWVRAEAASASKEKPS
jgi:hypothetical protein